MQLNNKLYDVLKWVAQIVLPAIGTLYFTLAQIWSWSNGEEVVGTIMAVDTFLGVLLGLSTLSWKNSPEAHDGYLYAKGADPDTGNAHLALTLTKDPKELLDKKVVTLQSEVPPEPKTE